LNVRDVMSTRLLTVEPSTPLADACGELHAHRIGAVLVMEDERVVGILTERDVLRAAATTGVQGAVADWMTRGPETIEPTDTTAHAASMMIHGGFRHLPVLENGRPVGIVSIRDLVRLLDDETPRGV
jgi:CBS domain-containing protein